MDAPVLTQLFQFVVTKARYPKRWKAQRLTPTHKRGAVSDEKDYRFLVVLLIVSVYFERTIGPPLGNVDCNFCP